MREADARVRLRGKDVMRPGRRELPATPEAWLEEIRAAYADAREAVPFGPVVGHRFDEAELFHLAPAVALKFRSLPARAATLKRATDAALASYVANLAGQGSALSDPRLAFGFCYLASHYGLGLVEMPAVESAMEFLERNVELLNESDKP
ncbi:MAG: hypothetical protein E6K81_13945 [Candidatus Eisenbacteria bacterium]|uniref:Uncharacterized protein n=1 Tax=Eiseniibacteriota bacterium TaxID=2212470 RepID=A0A538U1V1_UNCEI|nr:MAG: hypothetical protein E6K81_13945 [Candidatus Eisenbacteria bacterium]